MLNLSRPNKKSLKTTAKASVKSSPIKSPAKTPTKSPISSFFKKDESIEEPSPKNEKSVTMLDENKTPNKSEKSPKKEEKSMKLQTVGAGQKGADYNPAKKNYHPIDDAFWKKGEK